MGLIFSRFKRKRRMIDCGYTTPLGLYADCNTASCRSKKTRKGKRKSSDAEAIENLILARKLSPFYEGLPTPPFNEEMEPSPQLVDCSISKESAILSDNMSKFSLLECRARTATTILKSNGTDKRHAAVSGNFFVKKHKRKTQKTNKKYEIYHNGIECPICFLYYPRNINFSVCCDQPICTECFVQIIRKRKSLLKQKKKRSHLFMSDMRGTSSAASTTGLWQWHPSTSLKDHPEENLCPFCMTESFNIKYNSLSIPGESG